MTGTVDKINEFAGGSDHVELKFGYFFDSVFKHHTREEAEELFSCGGPKTTPALKDVYKEWPHPWLYARVFAVLLLTFGGLYVLSSTFKNPNGFPGLMFVGALMVPFATAVFFFETNAPRNLSFAYVVEIFFIGGVFSILCIYPLGKIFPGSDAGEFIPAMLTGIIEELAKVALVAFFMSRTKGRNYILSGLLIGAAVGAGFAVFETAGYIFYQGFWQNLESIYNSSKSMASSEQMNILIQSMLDITWTRAVLSIGGHVAWAATEGGALALCDEGSGFKLEHLFSQKFLPFLIATIVLHGIWDTISSIDVHEVFGIPFYYIKIVAIILIIWVVLFVLLHRGIAQVNELSEQAAAASDSAPARGDA